MSVEASPTRVPVNRERGEVLLDAREGWLVLRIDYAAVARFIEELGEDFDEKLNEANTKLDVATLSRAVAIAAQRHHPGIEAADIERMAPPFQVAFTRLGEAWHAFNWGAAPKPEDEEVPAAERARPLPGFAPFAAISRMLRGTASVRQSSGVSPSTS